MELGELPTRRTEEWKYSDLRLALRDAALPKGAPTKAPARAGAIDLLAAHQGAQETKVVERKDVLLDVFKSDDLDARTREIEVKPGARLTRIVVQYGAGVALSAAYVRVGAGGSFRQFVLSEGGKLARFETHVEVEGEGAEIELNGVYMCAADRHADLTSTIRHKVPNGVTRQLIKGAVRNGGRGVFQGKIIVDQHAQKTDARQHHQALLLEEGAEAFAKPELIINADDVQCAHGNTIGALDENALFYMRQRGLPDAQARAFLVEAFLSEAIPEGLHEDMTAQLQEHITVWLRSETP